MREIRPPSAILVEKVHKRYINRRALIGPPTESTSEPVLAPLKDKGVLFGFSENWKICKEYMSESFEGRDLWIATVLFVSIAGAEFALIALGVPTQSIDEDGNWKVFSWFIEKISEGEQ